MIIIQALGNCVVPHKCIGEKGYKQVDNRGAKRRLYERMNFITVHPTEKQTANILDILLSL